MSMADAALRLARDGWTVLPCHSAGARAKAPLLEHGHHEASSDPAVITRWWTRWPKALIGAVVPNSLAVLDVDPRNHGSMESLTAILGELPPTLTVMSGRGDGGRHLYYLRPGLSGSCTQLRTPAVSLTASRLPAGVDLKTSGYCILPPSPHPATGNPYRWIWRKPVPLPDRAVEMLRAPVRVARPALVLSSEGMGRKADALVRAVAAATVGERNAVLYWAVRRALDEGHDPGVLDLIVQAAEAAGLAHSEIEQTMTSARRGHLTRGSVAS